MGKPKGTRAIDVLKPDEARYLWDMFEKILIALQDAPPYCLIALGNDLLSFGMFNAVHAMRTPAQREELAKSLSKLIAELQKSLERYQTEYDIDHARLEASEQGQAVASGPTRIH